MPSVETCPGPDESIHIIIPYFFHKLSIILTLSPIKAKVIYVQNSPYKEISCENQLNVKERLWIFMDKAVKNALTF
jgi:hypothetical protein